MVYLLIHKYLFNIQIFKFIIINNGISVDIKTNIIPIKNNNNNNNNQIKKINNKL